jgi:hypothetical protein
VSEASTKNFAYASGSDLFLFFPFVPQVVNDALNLIEVLIADPFAAPVTAMQAIEDVLPHGERRHQTAAPLTAALQLGFEPPLPGEAMHAKEAALAGCRIGVGPLDFDGHG